MCLLFSHSKTIASVVNYAGKSFIKLTPGTLVIQAVHVLSTNTGEASPNISVLLRKMSLYKRVKESN